jgi:hypothetical protein
LAVLARCRSKTPPGAAVPTPMSPPTSAIVELAMLVVLVHLARTNIGGKGY